MRDACLRIYAFCVCNHGHVTLKTAPCCDPTSRIENRFRVGSTFVLLLNVSERHFADVNESEG